MFLGYPTNKDIESEYDSNPLTFDQLLQQEDSVLASGKPRTRRNSSGEKKKSPKLRYFKIKNIKKVKILFICKNYLLKT